MSRKKKIIYLGKKKVKIKELITKVKYCKIWNVPWTGISP